MRTEAEWLKNYQPHKVKKFSPRLQKDLLAISPPENLPPVIESTFIFGPVNSGKTLRAAFMMLQEEKQIWLNSPVSDEGVYHTPEYQFVFISCSELIQKIKNTYNNPKESEQAVLDFYSDVYFMVLDDFGIERTTDWCLNILYLILNRRYENLKKTIITSNLDLEALAAHLGDDRIPSRIERMCQIEVKQDYKKAL